MGHRNIEQRIASTERQLARLRENERQRDTRTKIIIGAVIMKEAGQNLAFGKWLAGRLRAGLRPKDLEQFTSYLTALESQGAGA